MRNTGIQELMFNSKKKIQPLSQKELTPLLRRVQKFLVQSSLHSTPKNWIMAGRWLWTLSSHHTRYTRTCKRSQSNRRYSFLYKTVFLPLPRTFPLLLSLNYTWTGLDKPQGFQQVEAPRIFRQSAHECGKVVSPKHRPPLPPMECLWYSFLLRV